jgi:hypothetical protein
MMMEVSWLINILLGRRKKRDGFTNRTNTYPWSADPTIGERFSGLRTIS